MPEQKIERPGRSSRQSAHDDKLESDRPENHGWSEDDHRNGSQNHDDHGEHSRQPAHDNHEDNHQSSRQPHAAATSGGKTTDDDDRDDRNDRDRTERGHWKREPTTTATTLNPIAQKLQGKPLGARIEKMLPSTMTLNTASAGFRNQGQFIAAVHVSQNLGIPFADLKAAILGTAATGTTTATSTTTSSPLSLGQAIQKLQPSANSTTEAARAQTQATADLSTTSSTGTTTPTTTTTTSTTSPTKKKR